MIEKTLESGKKISIRELSLDKIAELEDIQYFEYDRTGTTPKPKAIRNQSKSNLEWLREGLSACEGWVANGIAKVPDNILRKLSNIEKIEIVNLIQDAQILDEKKD